jgi:SAM-dependent methyltransferase
VASIYDDIYGQSTYWKFYHDISWDHMRPYLPRDLSVEVHDAGCGTGFFGLKLLKAGFRVLFSDISLKMLDVARRKVEEAGYASKASFERIDVADMQAVDDGRFGLVCAQGDPYSLCPDRARAFRELSRTIAPGGAAVLSVDNHTAGYAHFLEKKDLKGLLKFHRDGVLTWLAEKSDERFPVFTFEPRELVRTAKAAGLVLESMIGKCVLPVRTFPELLEERGAYKALLKVERKLGSKDANIGRASHIQAVFKKPA